MNVSKRWKPGGRQRQRVDSERKPEKQKKNSEENMRGQVILVPPLVPRRSRKEG